MAEACGCRGKVMKALICSRTREMAEACGCRGKVMKGNRNEWLGFPST